MTLSDLGFQNIRSSIVKGMWVLGVLFVMYIFDWHELLKGKVGEIWAGILALLGVLVLIYFFNLLSVPARMQAEADAEITKLKKQIFDRERRQTSINELWRFRSEGISLRNYDSRRIVSDADWGEWQAKYHAWRAGVMAAATATNINLFHWLDRLDRTVPNPSDLNFTRPEHERLARIMSTMLYRLQQFLEREMLGTWDTENI